MVLSTWVVSLVPFPRLRAILGRASYKTSIRVLIRGISVSARFHDEQYAPKSNGFCVANHTSPIDVGVLSVNTCFSLVGLIVGVILDGVFVVGMLLLLGCSVKFLLHYEGVII